MAKYSHLFRGLNLDQETLTKLDERVEKRIDSEVTAQIIAKHTIFVALLLSNGFYGVGEFNDETHQITVLYHNNLPTEQLAKNIVTVRHIMLTKHGIK